MTRREVVQLLALLASFVVAGYAAVRLLAGDLIGTGAWFVGQGVEAFWPEVVLTFAVVEPAEHHHVPLLLSPYAYSTYRGS